MAQESLVNYIRTQVSSGQRLDSVTSTLLKQGFSQQQIDQAYAQLGYPTPHQGSTSSTQLHSTKKNFLPIILIVLAIFVLLILSVFLFSKKNKSNMASHSTVITSPTPAVTQSLSACSLPTRWTSTVGTSFNAIAYLKPVSADTCAYTDSLLGYTVQYPANWYVHFNPAHPYNVISFDSQSLSASSNSPLAVSIYITPSKTNYSDIISYMESIQKSPGKSYQSQIEKNVYQQKSVNRQKAIQMQYTVGNSVGIDTKFIFNGVLYDVTFNGTSLDAINANKQYYLDLLNSFTLKPMQ